MRHTSDFHTDVCENVYRSPQVDVCESVYAVVAAMLFGVGCRAHAHHCGVWRGKMPNNLMSSASKMLLIIL